MPVRVMRLKNPFPTGQVAPMRIPLAFEAHAEDGALTILDSNSLLSACSRLAGGKTTHTSQLMEATAYNALGAMKAHYRGIRYKTRLSKLNATDADRIVLWDSTSSNIMTHHDSIPSVRVFLRVDPPPGGTAEAELHTMCTFPIPAGDTLDADMHYALKDDI